MEIRVEGVEDAQAEESLAVLEVLAEQNACSGFRGCGDHEAVPPGKAVTVLHFPGATEGARARRMRLPGLERSQIGTGIGTGQARAESAGDGDIVFLENLGAETTGAGVPKQAEDLRSPWLLRGFAGIAGIDQDIRVKLFPCSCLR